MALSRKKNKKEKSEKPQRRRKWFPRKKKKLPKEKCFFWCFPHITEKTTFLSEKNAYVFKTIEPEFNKIMVRQAVKKRRNVEPRKVRIINIPGKMVIIRRRQAQKPGYKKAIVYLKKAIK